MNQEKIGNFIAILRKEKGLTQRDLAVKLNVTDRTISNWENGKNMPDLALFIPLCSILDISVNELISGERLNNEMENFQENVIQTMMYSKRKEKGFWKVLLFFVLIIIIVCGCFLFVNYKNLLKENNEEENDFKIINNSSYYKNSNIPQMKMVIKDYLISKMDKTFISYREEVPKEIHLDNFVSIYILKLDEKKNKEIDIYLVAMVGSYYKSNEEDILFNGHGPEKTQFYKFTLKRPAVIEDNPYEIVNVVTTEEKEFLYEYEDFFDKYFPSDVVTLIKKYYRKYIWYELYFDVWNAVDTFYNI